MSGHSKWAGIKHKKAIVDAKRGQAFTRLSREIQIAAREGGGSTDSNFRLRLAVQKAREANMPADRIDHAIKRGGVAVLRIRPCGDVGRHLALVVWIGIIAFEPAVRIVDLDAVDNLGERTGRSVGRH